MIAFVPPQRTMLPDSGSEPKTSAQAAAVAARQRCKTQQGIWAYERRMADAEGGVAELKNEHGTHRARKTDSLRKGFLRRSLRSRRTQYLLGGDVLDAAVARHGPEPPIS